MIDLHALVMDTCVDIFGEVATWIEGDVEIDGVFDSRHIAVLDGAGAEVSALSTTFAWRPIGPPVGDPTVGDRLVIRCATYTIRDLLPDSLGRTVAVLERCADGI